MTLRSYFKNWIHSTNVSWRAVGLAVTCVISGSLVLWLIWQEPHNSHRYPQLTSTANPLVDINHLTEADSLIHSSDTNLFYLHGHDLHHNTVSTIGSHATSEIIGNHLGKGQHYNASMQIDPSVVNTGILDIRNFLERCPTNDIVYHQIRQDFELRLDDQVITSTITCTEPFSTLPISQLTNELIALQIFRTAYYMDIGTEGKLPWTQKSLYAWMKTNVSGVNFKTAPGQLYCCDRIDGKLYFSTSLQDDWQREFKRTWPGIASSLAFYAHEIRHADNDAPRHTTGCVAFPLPTDPPGCDATYDLNNLGSYGVQYWLQSNWAIGYLNIGIGCSPQITASSYAIGHANRADGFRNRIVNNIPPTVTATLPYGGLCNADLAAPTFPTINPATNTALITPTFGITITQAKPTFDWEDASDNIGVISYTLTMTHHSDSLSRPGITNQVTTLRSIFTPTNDLPNGHYTWTISAYDVAGNATTVTPAANFSIQTTMNLYFPFILRRYAS